VADKVTGIEEFGFYFLPIKSIQSVANTKKITNQTTVLNRVTQGMTSDVNTGFLVFIFGKTR
jgi:hypothetical protein